MLVTLERHAPIDIQPIEALSTAGDTAGAAAYFEKMGFATLLKRLIMPVGEEKPEIRARVKGSGKQHDAQTSLFLGYSTECYNRRN